MATVQRTKPETNSTLTAIEEFTPAIFEWYSNEVEEALQIVHEHDRAERQKLVETIKQFHDSNLFWKMFSKFDDAYAACKGDSEAEGEVMFALLARVYIAGTLARVPVFGDRLKTCY